MTEPTRDEVREMFGFEADKAKAMSVMYDTEHAAVMRWRAAAFRLALALLDEGEKDRERLESETRRAVIYHRQLKELRDALGIPVGQTWHQRVKTLLVAEAERDAAVKARDVVETMYQAERRRADRLQARDGA